MVFVDILALAALVLVGLFIVTQIVAPLVRGTPVLPLIRKDATQVQHDLEIARHKTDIARLERELELEKRKALQIAAMPFETNTQTTPSSGGGEEKDAKNQPA